MTNTNTSQMDTDTLLTAAYIGNGFSGADIESSGEFLKHDGELGLVERLVDAIPALDAEFKRRYGDDGIAPHGAPFVFAYEIAEPFGKLYAEMLAKDWSASPVELIKRLFDEADPNFKEPAQAPAYDLVRIKAELLAHYTQAIARDPQWRRDICVSGFQGLDSRSPEELVDMYTRFFKSNPPLLTTAASTPDGEERATA